MDSLRKDIVLGIDCDGNTYIIDLSEIRYEAGWIRGRGPRRNEDGLAVLPLDVASSGIIELDANTTPYCGSDYDGDVVFERTVEIDVNATTGCNGDYDGDTYHEQMGG